MIRTSLVIPRIRAQCPIFAGRVAGSLGWEKFARDMDAGAVSDFPVPHAFVLPLPDLNEGDIELSELEQVLPARFQVVVVVSNTSDEPGSIASDQLMDARDQLLKALIGFTPAEEMAPVLYAGMPAEPAFSRAKAWAQFDWYSTHQAAGAAG